MSRANSAVVLLIALGVTACATLDDFAMPALKHQAAIDMGCSADQLQVSETAQWHYAVDGCNKHGAYVMETCNKLSRSCTFLTEAQYIAKSNLAQPVQAPQGTDAQQADKNRQVARQKEVDQQLARQKEADQQRKKSGESEAQFRKRLDDQRREWDRQDQQRREEERRRQQQVDEQRRQDQARQDQQRQEQERRQREERNRQQQTRRY